MLFKEWISAKEGFGLTSCGNVGAKDAEVVEHAIEAEHLPFGRA